MGRTIVIGDVHGCLDELRRLVDACGVRPDDRVIQVGDLVGKGPDSRGVVQLMRERGFESVLGNHDAHVLRAHDGKLDRPPSATHQEVVAALTDEDWTWLRQRPAWLEVEEANLIVVHAGLVPGVPLREQPRECLLNMRSIDAQGRPSKRVEGGVPWASTWKGPQHVVFGHDAVRGLQQWPFATGLDTGCVYGKQLTALVLPERRLVSVDAAKVYCRPGG